MFEIAPDVTWFESHDTQILIAKKASKFCLEPVKEGHDS